ncbi:MAG: hypothetical protein P4N59_31760 [Negativicutes bacterium]|nr:hypothetical protein [Negativicutes bacterium]
MLSQEKVKFGGLQKMDFYCLFIVLLVFSLSDLIVMVTKGKVSSVFMILFLFLILFLTKSIPVDIIARAGLTQLGTIALGFLIFNMGTMMKWDDIKQEWRTAVICCLSVTATVICILALIPFMSKDTAFVSIPAVMGAVATATIITQAALKAGLTKLAALALVLFAAHKFVGIPLASIYGRREARTLLEQYRLSEGAAITESAITATKAKPKETIYEKYHLDKYYTTYVCLGVTAFFVWIANFIGNITHVNYTIWVLILGILVHHFGLVPTSILDRAKTSGFLTFGMFTALIPALANTKVTDIFELGVQAILIMAVVVIGQYIVFYILPTWKIIKSKNLCFGIAMCQMLGYPSTYLVSHEIANIVGTTEAEKAYILKGILPKYLIAGFVSVTFLSVFLAGILGSML